MVARCRRYSSLTVPHTCRCCECHTPAPATVDQRLFNCDLGPDRTTSPAAAQRRRWQGAAAGRLAACTRLEGGEMKLNINSRSGRTITTIDVDENVRGWAMAVGEPLSALPVQAGPPPT